MSTRGHRKQDKTTALYNKIKRSPKKRKPRERDRVTPFIGPDSSAPDKQFNKQYFKSEIVRKLLLLRRPLDQPGNEIIDDIIEGDLVRMCAVCRTEHGDCALSLIRKKK
jgi:hypothetical protein